MEFIKRIKAWQAALGLFVTITSVYSGAAAIGLDIPRFAWITEVQAAERKVNSLELRIERLHHSALRRQWNDVVSRIAELEAKSITVPSRLKIMEEQLRGEMQEQNEYIKDLRKSEQ